MSFFVRVITGGMFMFVVVPVVVIAVALMFVIVIVIVIVVLVVVAVLLFLGIDERIDSENEDADSPCEDEVVEIRGEVFAHPGGVIKIQENASP